MAIIPKDKYAGQTDEADPGYPLGKAKNIGVPGDGTGTPWEEDLVNDIFGFQQALLEAGNITPSEVPDKVGASDYVDAIQTMINTKADPIAAGLAAVNSAAHTWTGTHQFNGSTTLGPGQELGYDATRLRKVLIPLTDFVPTAVFLGVPSWATVYATDVGAVPAVSWRTNAADDLLRAVVRVPDGSFVHRLRMRCEYSLSTQVSMYRERFNTSGAGASPPVRELLGTAAASSELVDTGGLAYSAGLVFSGATDLLAIELSNTTGHTHLYWAELWFYDPGPRNF